MSNLYKGPSIDASYQVSVHLAEGFIILLILYIIHRNNMTGAISGAGTAYPSTAHEFTPDFYWGLCYSIFSFMCI
jgi:hypothetical protein